MSAVLSDANAVIVSMGLTRSPTALNARNIPNTVADLMFSLTMQTTNSKKFRERSPGLIRYSHELTVGILGRLKPLNQAPSYEALIDTEEGAIKALMTQFKMPPYRVEYERTRRTITTSGEYLFLEIVFSIEQTGDLV